ncbi:Replication protein repB [Streptococcus pyogenes]|nr:Replication protein repB [Streptococcus pyogenes]
MTLDVEEKGELFNVVVSVIRAYMLENIFDLYDFVEENGEAYGFTIKLVNEVIAGKTGFMKLLFDGAYQRRKRGGGNG